MAESDRPSSSSGNRRRLPLKQTRSVDAAACMFEMEGIDFEDDQPGSSVSSNSGLTDRSQVNRGNNANRRTRTRSGDGDEGGPEEDDEDFNNNNDSDDDNGNGSNNNSSKTTSSKRTNNKNLSNRQRNSNRGRRVDGDVYTDDEEDEEEDDDENDGENETRSMFQRMNLNSNYSRQFAASLPIQVPLWKTSPLNQETDDTDSEQNITCDEDPRKIAESFRALAWSVKDGTEMFGDLPRHRLKSRPI